MITVRKSEARGHSHFGWLDSRHSFSFGEYFDERHMGFSALRVINDDRVTPGAGFGMHGHRDMEIITCVLDGVIAHKDSEGNISELRPGEFQLMSAGSGIRHSEFNASADKPLHFLMLMKQDARLHQMVLPAGASQELPIAEGRRGWVHVIEGQLQIGSHALAPGDGAGVASKTSKVKATEPVRALLFDLP
jgi:quercetin 2,3-dioxygenase